MPSLADNVYNFLSGVSKKDVVLPFATDPKILKSTVGFKKKLPVMFFREKKYLMNKKICFKAFKTEKYQPKEGEKNL